MSGLNKRHDINQSKIPDSTSDGEYLVKITKSGQNYNSSLISDSALTLSTSLSADGDWSGMAEAGTAGTALAFGDLCYLAVADSRWELANAGAEATSFGKLGVCILAAAGDGSPTKILLLGKIRADAAFPSLTVGAPVFISTTSGKIVTASPVGSGEFVRSIGYGNTADELYFNPDNSYSENP